MTANQVRSFKKRFGRHFDRIAKMVRKMKGLSSAKKRQASKALMRDLKREEQVIVRIQKRASRLAKAA